MHKYLISSAIALTLFGCGGGESGGSSSTPSPTVKYYNVSFFDLDNVAENDQNSCQIFGYNDDKTRKVIAYRSVPENNYKIVIHDKNGNFVRRYTNQTETNGLGSTFRFKQSDVPADGYISFSYSEGRDHFISTFSKSLILETFSIYANNKNNNINCLVTSTNHLNPQEKEYSAFIESPDLTDNNFFYSINKLNQDFLGFSNCSDNPSSCRGEKVTAISPANKPVMLTAYKREISEVKNLFAFEFAQTNNLSATNTIGNSSQKIKLHNIENLDNSWNPPIDVDISLAQLFVDGRKFNASNAYLWQPLTTDVNSTYSYSELIEPSNYYLNLQGKESTISEPHYWAFRHVAQGTNEIASHLSAEGVLNSLPSPQYPNLDDCYVHSGLQCIQISSTPQIDDTILRVSIDAELTVTTGLPQFIKQTFYTPYHMELPVMKFDDITLDQQIKAIEKSSISWIKTESSSIIDTFLYQYQNLYNRTISSELIDPLVDNIPLLKNISAQLEHDDLLKRQPYTWVWLEENND
ncbi:hypothetical protein [Vibrio cincinnatiensis]|uniref:hypothetical protein n=1 Tax=Vibrio cincinnatiensis TaxID=675 RepID=UPI001FA9B438|nr:hypothetical protein [Vibrio cincinnatiensis]